MTDVLLPPGRQTARALVRSAGITVGLVFLYYLVPIDGIGRLGTALGLIATGVIFAAAAVWEIRRIGAAEFPGLTAVEAMATLVPLLLLLFASLYLAMSEQVPSAFSETFNRTGALYFTVTTFATVGFGDITPVSDLARIATMAQMVLDLVVLTLVVRLVFNATQKSVARRQDQRRGQPD